MDRVTPVAISLGGLSELLHHAGAMSFASAHALFVKALSLLLRLLRGKEDFGVRRKKGRGVRRRVRNAPCCA